MRTIYKFPIQIKGRQKIEFLKEPGTTPRILHVGLDPAGVPCVWVELYVGTYPHSFEIVIVCTGGKISGAKAHVGSFVQDCFVWHVYA